MSLTPRECEVVALRCEGLELQEIADALCISPLTVGKHADHAKQALNAKTQYELVARFARGER